MSADPGAPNCPGGCPPRYASFLRRFAAHVVDDLILDCCIGLLFYGVLAAAGLVDAFTSGVEGGPLPGVIAGFAVFQLVLSWLYYASMESSSRGATLGKLLFGIKVTMSDGDRLTFGEASLRFVGKIISGIIIIGYLFPLFTKRKQALHDLLADTVVIKEE